MENGLTPGRDYPVYETDVGRIGIVTCSDTNAARILTSPCSTSWQLTNSLLLPSSR